MRPQREAANGLYTTILGVLSIYEQNNIIWPAQGVGAAGFATIFGKMNGIAAFVEARGGRLGFGRMRKVNSAERTGEAGALATIPRQSKRKRKIWI